MKKMNRDTILAIGLVFILAVLTLVAALSQAQEDELPALSSHSNAANGARALALWLEEMGYQVDNQVGEKFAPPEGADAIFILEPGEVYPISSPHWNELEPWLNSGGFLLIASSEAAFGPDSSPIETHRKIMQEEGIDAIPAAPLFRAPPLRRPLLLDLFWWIETDRQDAVPLLTVNGSPVAMEFIQGKGRVVVITNSAFLSNAGLKETGNAELLLNLIAPLPRGSQIWLDEWHHGERLASAGDEWMGPEAWLTRTPSGFAFLFAGLVIFIGLVLSGRRFGRPVPLPSEVVRRAPLEYVTAIANLSRRAGHRRALMQSYRTSIKRAYGKRYRLDTNLPDQQFVNLLASYKPGLDAPGLLNLLQRLDRHRYTEAQIVQLARESADWLKDIEK